MLNMLIINWKIELQRTLKNSWLEKTIRLRSFRKKWTLKKPWLRFIKLWYNIKK